MHSVKAARVVSDVLIGIGMAVWAATAIALMFVVSEDQRVWGLVGGVLLGALAFLQVYILAIVLRLLADIADGVNNPSSELVHRGKVDVSTSAEPVAH